MAHSQEGVFHNWKPIPLSGNLVKLKIVIKQADRLGWMIRELLDFDRLFEIRCSMINAQIDVVHSRRGESRVFCHPKVEWK
jgi:hypothetical protein